MHGDTIEPAEQNGLPARAWTLDRATLVHSCRLRTDRAKRQEDACAAGETATGLDPRRFSYWTAQSPNHPDRTW